MLLEPAGQSTVPAGPEFSLRKPSVGFQRGQTAAAPQEIHQSPTESGIVKQPVNVGAGNPAVLTNRPVVHELIAWLPPEPKPDRRSDPSAADS
jgi:hypothetical protein